MNEKFYNLSKEKQDRMINGSIKVFAQNGYDKASTDIIIVEAGISKGLLFHYFGSKKNLYYFVMEYCARYLIMELKASIPDSEKNLFERVKLVEQAKLMMLKNYPFLDLFLICAAGEQSEDVKECAADWSSQVDEAYRQLLNEKSDPDLIRGNISVEDAREIVNLCMEGYKSRMYKKCDTPEEVLEGFMPYLEALKANFTR